MDTPIAALLWSNHAKQDPEALLRMVTHLERRCVEMGADEAAVHLAAAAAVLRGEEVERRLYA